MTEEQKQPAAEQDDAKTPAPAPPAGDDGKDAANEAPSGDKIGDPVAYWQSQAEKYERLHKRQAEQVTTLEEKIKGLEQAQRDEITQKLTELQTNWETEKATIQKELLGALRTAAAAKFGLTPTLASRLQGETEAEIMADAEALAKELPQGSTKSAKVGNPGGGSKLTVDDLKDKSAKWISENWDQVEGILGDQQKK